MVNPDGLPAPVARYLGRALLTENRDPERVLIRQSGRLRTGTSSRHWMRFSAMQTVVPSAHGFTWDARVRLPLGAHLQVVDRYMDGEASGRVRLFSAFTLASASNDPELNSGALHRFLAESAWYPFALLPGSGVTWAPIDDRSAMATLTHRGSTVSLEFRFNAADELAAIYTPGRYGRFNGAYRKVPWEGHFREYVERDGFRIPLRAEVGWHEADELRLVWQGRVDAIEWLGSG